MCLIKWRFGKSLWKSTYEVTKIKPNDVTKDNFNDAAVETCTNNEWWLFSRAFHEQMLGIEWLRALSVPSRKVQVRKLQSFWILSHHIRNFWTRNVKFEAKSLKLFCTFLKFSFEQKLWESFSNIFLELFKDWRSFWRQFQSFYFHL